MAFNITEFTSALKYGGARSGLFQVTMTNPIQPNADRAMQFLCRATSIPQREITAIPVPYFSRNIKVAGVNETYPDWEVTIINDEDWLIRNALEEWSHNINSPVGNIRLTGSSSPADYKSTADVIHFSQTGEVLRHYKMVGVWPSNIANITLDWGTDEVMSFACTFAMDYWTIGDQSQTGFAGGVSI